MDEYTRNSELGMRRDPVAIPFRLVDDAAEMLGRLFRGFTGMLTLRLWDGTTLRWHADSATDASAAPCTLAFRNPEAVGEVVRGSDPFRLVEGYLRGDIDIEGDLFAALALSEHLNSVRLSFAERVSTLLTTLRVRAIGAAQSHSSQSRRSEQRSRLEFPESVPNEFYALWLDRAMVYSCAYFEQVDADLDRAQLAKLDHICRKLQLKAGEAFLDIDCGWGALVMHAAAHYGVRAHGVTRSEQQLQLAQQRIAEAGLEDRVSVELRDYRELAGAALYDKVASVGMLEHIGHASAPALFSTVNRLLKTQGLFLNHGITHESGRSDKSALGEFVNRYVFPNGHLDTVSHLQSTLERECFEIADVEALRSHYALTFRHWDAKLQQQHEQALKFVSESRYRLWRVYMAACAVEFETGSHGLYQVLASKRDGGGTTLPLTRQQQYAGAGSN